MRQGTPVRTWSVLDNSSLQNEWAEASTGSCIFMEKRFNIQKSQFEREADDQD